MTGRNGTATRRGFLKGGLVVAEALTLPSPAVLAQRRRSVAVGTASITLQYLPLYMGIKSGAFADQGLDIEIVNTQSGPRTRQALAARQILVGFSAVADVPALTIAGRRSTLMFPIDRKMAWANVLVRKADYDSGKIKSIQDLSGRTIAVTQPKSAAWASMMEIAKNANFAIEPKFQSLGDLASMLAALKSERVDATLASVEMINQAEGDGWGVAIFSSADEAAWTRYLGGETPGVGGYTLTRTVESDAETLQSVVNGLVKGTDAIFARSPAEIAGILHAEYFNSFERGALEKAIRFYQSSIYSKTNIFGEEQWARVLDIFGHDRLFSGAEAADPALSFAQAVDLGFVKKARAL